MLVNVTRAERTIFAAEGYVLLRGVLEPSTVAELADVLAMRPLLVHGSCKARVPARRRVLHIEYCAGELDPPLRWPEW